MHSRVLRSTRRRATLVGSHLFPVCANQWFQYAIVWQSEHQLTADRSQHTRMETQVSLDLSHYHARWDRSGWRRPGGMPCVVCREVVVGAVCATVLSCTITSAVPLVRQFCRVHDFTHN